MRSWTPVTWGWARTAFWMDSTRSGSGLWPRRGSRVSLAASQPARRMKAATRMPTQPSMRREKKCPASVPSSTAEVATTSERESAAVAAMAAEPMRRLRRRLKADIHSFTRIEAQRMPTDSQEKSTASGWRIFSREVRASSTPTSRMAAATRSPVRYSMRPWPKGWSSSACLAARRKPARVTTEEPASERLLKASAVTAMEPVSSPARNFPAERSRLRRMPTPPERRP